MSGRFRLLLGPRVPAVVGPDAPGSFRMGINMSGPESGNSYPTLDMLQHYAAHGMPYIRLPLSWIALQPTVGGAISTSEFAKVAAVMATCAALKMSILMDPNHSTLLGAGRDNINRIGSAALPTSAIADYLGKFVAACRADPNYAVIRGWDTTNEPHAMDPNDSTNTSTAASRATVQDMLQKIITAIRATGDRLPIYCEADHYSGAWDWVTNNATLFLALTDPLNALVASVHTYLDRDSSGANFNWTTETQQPGKAPPGLSPNINIGVQRMSALVTWARQNGVKLHLGECGWGMNEAGWNQAGDALLAYLQANNVEFTYWSSGFNFGPNLGYQYDPDPFTPGTNTGNFTGAGQASPQSAILQKYAGAPTTYVLSLPSDVNNRPIRYGASGQESAPFKILFGGKLTQNIVVTPTDFGAGGTFTPASVTMTAGQHINEALSFTYTPASAAQFRIGTTNNGGLVDPAPVIFASILDPFVQSGIVVDPMNVLWPNRIFQTFTGPALSLAKASTLTASATGPTLDVPFLAAGALDTATLDDYLGGAAGKVVKFYDQGLNHADLGPIITNGVDDNKAGPASPPSFSTGTYLGITPNLDCPALVEGAYNGLAALRFNASRMDAYATIEGLAGFTMLFAVNPQTTADAAFLFNWVVSDFFQVGDPSGNLQISDSAGQQTASLGIVPGSMHVYAVRFDGVGKTIDIFRDAGKVNSIATTRAVIENQVSPSQNNHDPIRILDVGWYKYYPSGKSRFDLAGLITLPAALTDAQVGIFLTRMTADVGVVQVGTPGAMTANGTPGQNDIPVKLASAPSNANAIKWQYRRSGQNAWIDAGMTSVSAGPSALQFDVTGLVPNLNYDVQAFGVNGSYLGAAAQLLGQHTATAPEGSGPKLSYIGINLSHYENVTGEDTTLYPQVDYWTGSLVGFNMFRVPTHWRNWAPTIGQATLDAAYGTNVDKLVNYITGKGAVAIVDIHDFGSYDGSNAIGSGSGPTQAQFAAFCGQIAARYAGKSLVRLDIMNEPAGISAASWLSCCNAALTAIRNAGFTGVVYVPVIGPNVSSFSSCGFQNGGLVDPGNNFVVTGHQYFNGNNYDGASSGVTNQTVGVSRLKRITTWARRWGLKLYLGEFGAGRGSDAADCIGNVMEYLQANADVWESATLWAAGDFGIGYVLDLNPVDSGGSETRNWTSAAGNAPQVNAVTPYMAGGTRRGQAALPITMVDNPVNLGTITTGGAPIFPGFGGSSTGVSGGTGAGGVYPDQFYNCYTDVDALTLDVCLNLTSNGSTQYLGGNDSAVFMWVDATGHLCGSYGQGSNKVTLTGTNASLFGAAHRATLSAGPAGAFLFLDGQIVAQSATTYVAAGFGNNGGALNVRGGYYPNPAGLISHFALFTAQKYTAAFTPLTTPWTGAERDLLCMFPLVSDQACRL